MKPLILAIAALGLAGTIGTANAEPVPPPDTSTTVEFWNAFTNLMSGPELSRAIQHSKRCHGGGFAYLGFATASLWGRKTTWRRSITISRRQHHNDLSYPSVFLTLTWITTSRRSPTNCTGQCLTNTCCAHAKYQVGHNV